ncbi:FliM/FliN family flagellar motor switch protein [Rhodobacteraceae bacterium]|nr:FliM/FliN family flagellar motor switch protein [Paracoccaceae bacterium]
MSEAVSALRKKTAPAKTAVPGGASIGAILRKLMPRVADQAMALDVMVGEVKFGTSSKSDVMADLGDNDLIYLMEDQRETRAICVVKPGLLAALIEKQVSGRVSEGAPPDRVATRTDGIVVADIVDRWTEAAQIAAVDDGLDDVLPFVGFRRFDRVLNKRNTDLSLDPVDFRTLSIELSLEGGAKTGELCFAVPVVEPELLSPVTAKNRIHKHLAEIEAPMVAILTRVPVAMERVKKLAVDDVIDVPISALMNVQLEGTNGHKIIRARLGQLNGKKAVRLSFGAIGGEAAAGLSVLGAMPEPGAMARTPALPEPLAPMSPDLVDSPDIDPPGDFPALDGLPDLPAADGTADLPELPDLPDLPELLDLPDLPN